MTSPQESGIQPDAHDLYRLIDTYQASAYGDHVGVVVHWALNSFQQTAQRTPATLLATMASTYP